MRWEGIDARSSRERKIVAVSRVELRSSLFSVRGNLDGFVRERRSARSVRDGDLKSSSHEIGLESNRRLENGGPVWTGQPLSSQGFEETVNTHW